MSQPREEGLPVDTTTTNTAATTATAIAITIATTERAQTSFKVGDYVKSTWNGVGKLYDCLIEVDNGDDTFGLLFNDGDFRKKADKQWLTYDEANNQDEELKDTSKSYWKCPDDSCGLSNHKWRKRCKNCQEPNPSLPRLRGFGNGGIGMFFDPEEYFKRTIQRAEDDAQAYLQGYPGQQDNLNKGNNLAYYSNELRMKPDNYLVEEFHKEKWGDYDFLEEGHSFIQWLFPIREQGLNYQADPLQKWEADKIAADPTLQGRIIKSYQLLLNFYGMRLYDEKTGDIRRNEKNFEARYDNLERCTHNFLRITRILKCLGEVGLSHYQYPFMQHVFNEIFLKRNLECCEQSARLYWVNVVKNDKERAALKEFALKFRDIPRQSKHKPWGRGGHAKLEVNIWDELEGEGPAKDPSTCKFKVGEEVVATWDKKKKMYAATVKAINKDGTYRVLYGDGDHDNFVEENQILTKVEFAARAGELSLSPGVSNH